LGCCTIEKNFGFLVSYKVHDDDLILQDISLYIIKFCEAGLVYIQLTTTIRHATKTYGSIVAIFQTNREQRFCFDPYIDLIYVTIRHGYKHRLVKYIIIAINYSIMILNIKMCNNKQPQLSVLSSVYVVYRMYTNIGLNPI